MSSSVAALSILLSLAAPAKAQEIVAVLSSNLPEYRETFESFEKALGRKVPSSVFPAPPAADSRTRVVVAFGGKAASEPFPAHIAVVYCLSLGPRIQDHPGMVKINTTPAPEALLEAAGSLRPGLKRLGVLWASDGFEEYADLLKSAARGRGVKLALRQVRDPGQLPDGLRSMGAGLDALWVPPDPLLLDARNLEILKSYSAGNGVPLFTSAPGLTEKGAAAGFVVSFEEIGRLAAQEALEALENGSISDSVYADKISVSVNLAAAKAAGLDIPEDALKKADKILR